MQSKAKRVPSAPSTIRLSLDLSEADHERLGILESQTHAETKRGVVRDALRFYEFIVQKTLKGCKFKIEYPNGDIETAIFFNISPPT